MSTVLTLLGQASSFTWLSTVPLPVWIVAGIVGWIVVAVLVGLVVARVIRHQDEQVSKDRAKALFRERPSPEEERVAHKRYVAEDWGRRS